MKKATYIFPALFLIVFSACVRPPSDSQTTNATAKPVDTTLTTKIKIAEPIALGSPIEMTFTVYNTTTSAKTFCKWHTPFEPLMSKYLTIYANTAEEVSYKGPMAKRMMPPPADSYLTIKPGDSLSVKVDLSKAYEFKLTGVHTILYNSGSISGLNIAEPVSFVIQ